MSQNRDTDAVSSSPWNTPHARQTQDNEVQHQIACGKTRLQHGAQDTLLRSTQENTHTYMQTPTMTPTIIPRVPVLRLGDLPLPPSPPTTSPLTSPTHSYCSESAHQPLAGTAEHEDAQSWREFDEDFLFEVLGMHGTNQCDGRQDGAKDVDQVRMTFMSEALSPRIYNPHDALH